VAPDPDEFDDEAEGQDLAEVFDEENITPDGRDIATSDMEPDVFDVTRVAEDADAALAPQDDFDPDTLDEAEWEEIVLADEDPDGRRTRRRDLAALVLDEGDEEAETAPMEPEDLSDADIEALGYAREEAPPEVDLDQRLDDALDATFPASDPFSINRPA
jgi:hypothetical protein